MRSLLAVALIVFSFPLLAQAPAGVALTPLPKAAVLPPDPAADALAKRAIQAQGGAAWEKARYFSFTFVVERNGQPAASFAQQWDRVTGDYRVSGVDPKGVPFSVLVNVKTKSGRAWQKGVEVTDLPAVQNLLALGYRRYINDTYWLLMPLKMLDAGVHRNLQGERTDAAAHKWDVIRLTFDPGLEITNDVCFAWVNRETGLVDEWDMRAPALLPTDPPVEVFFKDFRRVAGVLISMQREVKGKNQTVRFNDLQILPETPKGAFDVK
ncbi:MAG TPA: hypothetical protein VGQ46_05975 [Thermoanaerobaculia bacterium]|nr:hypothetical protein [Thermoanaerobaculia bacterium]